MTQNNKFNIDFSEIQGNVIRGYGAHAAKYIFYQIDQPKEGREWLRRIQDACEVTTSEFWRQGTEQTDTVRTTFNVALSHSGLQVLGVSESFLDRFPQEFKEGMAKRAVEILGDEPQAPLGGSKKEHQTTPILPEWATNWFYPPKDIHALVIITAKVMEDTHRCNEAVHQRSVKHAQRSLDVQHHALMDLAERVGGIHELRVETGTKLYEGREHFGFKDGISQPFIEGTQALFKDKINRGLNVPFDGQGTPKDDGTWKPLMPGEFILGYPDETELPVRRTENEELWKNGTYLVFRKLSQNVRAFNEFLKATAKNDLGTDNQKNQEFVAAKLMGRWRSGCPLIGSPKTDQPSKGKDPRDNNDFLYEQDPDGDVCPLGSHIRRTNPRDAFKIGNSVRNLRHRILRRGMPYTKGKSKGLLFMAINASISRQFEFVQQHWVNNGDFLGLDRQEQDPVIGPSKNRKFTMPGMRFPFKTGIQRFVTPQGGEYFFYPSKTALQGLAHGKYMKKDPDTRSFLSMYDDLEHVSSDKNVVAAQRHQLLADWIKINPRELFEELRNEKPILEIPAYHDPRKGPQLAKFVVSTYKEVREVLDHPEAFSVALYTKKMAAGGGFILGMPNQEQDKAQYAEELQILRKALRPEDLDRIQRIVGQVADERLQQIIKSGSNKLDVVADFARLAPALLIERYFGVIVYNPAILMKLMRVIFADTFLNFSGDNKELENLAKKGMALLQKVLKATIADITKKVRSTEASSDEDVLTRLVRMQQDTETRFRDKSSVDGVIRNIIGIIVGVLETTSKSITYGIEQLLIRPDHLCGAQKAALCNDDKRLAQYMFEAMRFKPQSPILFRLSVRPYTLATVPIPPKSVVVVGTQSAMFDSSVIPDPEEFRVDRPYDETYLFYGYSLHRCLGEYINNVQIPEVAKRILRLKGLRRARGEDGNLEEIVPRGGLFPDRFMLEFDSE